MPKKNAKSPEEKKVNKIDSSKFIKNERIISAY
jgi:hypothetical protein